jgi:hypothetical protein
VVITMNAAGSELSSRSEVRKVLLRLAKHENDRAADEASRVPYWEACPAGVIGRRAAAAVLLLAADTLAAPCELAEEQRGWVEVATQAGTATHAIT